MNLDLYSICICYYQNVNHKPHNVKYRAVIIMKKLSDVCARAALSKKVNIIKIRQGARPFQNIWKEMKSVKYNIIMGGKKKIGI